MIGTSPKRLAAALAAAGLFSSLAPLGAIAAFTDVKTSTSYSTAIEALREKGVLAGYEDNTFKPGQTINRAEFLKIVLEGRGSKDFNPEDCFPDVKSDHWFSKYVCTAKKEGIVGGYPDGSFKPEQTITFVEAGKILALAYKQQTQEQGNDWYVPYAKALESAKAIPPSINGLDRAITRGEMAEMMWRISEKKTDQPTKGLLNVKYPEVRVNLASDAVQIATSCADLRAFVNESATGFEKARYGATDGAVPPMAPMPTTGAREERAVNQDAAQSGGGGSAGDHSRTNVQVEGVDEGDIVKTDGTYLYVVRGQTVKIVQAVPAGSMKIVSTLDFTKDNFNPTDLYIDGNRMIVIGNSWAQDPTVYRGGMEKRIAPDMIMPAYWNTSLSEVRIYNVSDRANPKNERTVSFQGNQISTRKIGAKLYLVMNQGMPYWGRPIPLDAKEADILPTFNDSAKNVSDQPVTGCSKIAILPHVPSPQYLIVAMIPTDSTSKDVQKTVILGNGENVYASLENLYVANTHWNYEWDSARSSSREETNVFRFRFTDAGTEMQAQGKVPGRILNQFSMDEHEASFRIATTVGNNWEAGNRSTNNLYILNRDMQTVGKIEDIAPGEQIYSARFLGDRAYMVTFRTVDPLFVIDTSDPRNPKILGQLKIPGYSNYLHPYDENHIIGFGKEAVASKDETNAWYQGMKMAIFDVRDVTKPKELHNEVIGDRGTDSPLLYNHKALLFEKDRNLLAFPVTVAQIKDRTPQYQGQDPASLYGTPVFQGAYVYNVSLKDGFTLRGKITHYTAEDLTKMGDYFYGKTIERIVRSGEHLLTVGEGGVQSHGEKDVKFEGKVDFPETQNIYYPMPMRGGGTAPGVAVPETAPAPPTR